MSDYEWIAFADKDPERYENILVWCGHDNCVKHIEDFRSEDRSNNWLLWRYCPTPEQAQIDRAQARADKELLRE